MARSSFPVEVLTPEGKVFEDEVEMVSTRTTTGSIGILANHAPLMAILEPTELRLYKSESEIVRFAQGEGYLQVVDNRALVLVEDAGPRGVRVPPARRPHGARERRGGVGGALTGGARGQALRGVPGGRLGVGSTAQGAGPAIPRPPARDR